MCMQITLTKEQVKEAFGELRFRVRITVTAMIKTVRRKQRKWKP